MASSSCECKNGNKLSDLKKAELSLQLVKQVSYALVGERAKAVYEGLVAFPDLAVKFVDALKKSEGDSFAYADFAEAAGALVDIFVAGAKVVGVVNPIYNIGSTVVNFALLANDLTDSNSPIRRLYDQLTDARNRGQVILIPCKN